MKQSLMIIQKSTIEPILDRTERELLERHEDHYLSRVAEKSNVVDAKTYSHEDTWKDS
jgi:hypothetical protein